ncbi:MAG: hypothetical protein AAF590_12840 [Pseudomonadota bacterium]
MPNQHPPPTHPPTRQPTEVAPTEVTPTQVTPIQVGRTETPARRPTIHLDPEEWLPYLDDPDATYDEKIELIETLWGIVLSFVDLGWTIDTEEPACGSNLPPGDTFPSVDLTRALHAAMVHLDEPEKEPEREDV